MLLNNISVVRLTPGPLELHDAVPRFDVLQLQKHITGSLGPWLGKA